MTILFIALIDVLKRNLCHNLSTKQTQGSIDSKAYTPSLEKPTMSINEYMQRHCQLPLHKRTLAALRSTYHSLEKQYILLALLEKARDQNMPENDIQRIKDPIISQGWAKEQQLILLIADDLTLNGSIRYQLLEQLHLNYSLEQILSFVLCISQPHLLL